MWEVKCLSQYYVNLDKTRNSYLKNNYDLPVSFTVY